MANGKRVNTWANDIRRKLNLNNRCAVISAYDLPEQHDLLGRIYVYTQRYLLSFDVGFKNIVSVKVRGRANKVQRKYIADDILTELGYATTHKGDSVYTDVRLTRHQIVRLIMDLEPWFMVEAA